MIDNILGWVFVVIVFISMAGCWIAGYLMSKWKRIGL